MIRVCTSRILEPASIIKSIVLNYQLLLWMENVIGLLTNISATFARLELKSAGVLMRLYRLQACRSWWRAKCARRDKTHARGRVHSS